MERESPTGRRVACFRIPHTRTGDRAGVIFNCAKIVYCRKRFNQLQMSTVRQTGPRDTPAIGRRSLRDLFDAQRAAFDRGVTDYDQRMAALRSLEAALLGHQDEIVRAT